MRAGIFTTTIEERRDLGLQQTRHFRLRFAPGTEFDFEAGQFINLLIETEEKTLKRPYSIASSPRWKGTLDLCWKKVAGGLATDYLWNLKEGDSVKIQGPLGRFTVRNPLPHRIAFVSTGTGIAPFRAMMHDLIERKSDTEIWNVFGNRYEDDILYREEFEQMAAGHPNFHNVFTVSRPEKWRGETEYVQHLLKKHLKTSSHTHLYICGLSSMILDVEKKALDMGFSKEQIFYEKYD